MFTDLNFKFEKNPFFKFHMYINYVFKKINLN
jgi:hypothetical protein